MRLAVVGFMCMCNVAFAVSQNNVTQKLNGLMTKINQINQDIASKTQQQKSLNDAIADSDSAIDESVKLLNSLRQSQTTSIQQLNAIAAALPQFESVTQATQAQVKATITTIYLQIRTIRAESDSVVGGNDVLQSRRKQQYLIQLLSVKQEQYHKLEMKLNELSRLNKKLKNQVERLSKQLGKTAQKAEQLKAEQQAKLEQQEELQQQIAIEQEQLSGLKQKQAELNQLMIKLSQATKPRKKPGHGPVKQPVTPQASVEASETAAPFYDRKLAKPLNTKVSIPFGAIRHGVRNNGVVYNTSNAPVFAISDGMIIYDGELPGLGRILVINHGDNYMSVYGGIIPAVHKGQSVSVGQIIANAGVSANQPMGGVYFELRHMGQPVNPAELVN